MAWARPRLSSGARLHTGSTSYVTATLPTSESALLLTAVIVWSASCRAARRRQRVLHTHSDEGCQSGQPGQVAARLGDDVVEERVVRDAAVNEWAHRPLGARCPSSRGRSTRPRVPARGSRARSVRGAIARRSPWRSMPRSKWCSSRASSPPTGGRPGATEPPASSSRRRPATRPRGRSGRRSRGARGRARLRHVLPVADVAVHGHRGEADAAGHVRHGERSDAFLVEDLGAAVSTSARVAVRCGSAENRRAIGRHRRCVGNSRRMARRTRVSHRGVVEEHHASASRSPVGAPVVIDD